MSSDKLHDPFVITENKIIVELLPSQMNSNLYSHLKRNIEMRVLGKCNNVGLFIKVEKLIKYDENEINIENFTSNAEYSVTFLATVCIPLPDTEVILRVEKTICEHGNYLLNAGNGALSCVLSVKNNSHFLSMKNSKIYIAKYDKYIEVGNYIKILIKNKRSDPRDEKIGIAGKIIDIATEEEIKNHYYKSETIINDVEEPESIVFNDDVEEEKDTEKSIYADI